jgi:hypothetical protein
LVQKVTIQFFPRYVFLVVILCFIGFGKLHAQQNESSGSTTRWLDSLQTIGQYVREHLAELTPPKLKEQLRVRHTFQQRGYTSILLDVLNQDGLSALISFFKVNLHVEYSMTHKVFWIIPPDPRSGNPGIPFPDDWSFPTDPWKEW